MGTVFEDFEVVFGSDFHNGVHIGRHTGIMNHYNGFRSWSDSVLNIFGVDADSVGVYIGEDRRGAERVSLCDRGPISKTRCDDFVADANTQTVHGTQDGSGPVMIRQSILSTQRLGVLFLKFLCYFKAGHLPCPQNFQDRLLMLLSDNRPPEYVPLLRLHCLFTAE